MKDKLLKGLKKYRVYLYSALAVIMAVVVISISLAASGKNGDVIDVVNPDTIKFSMPIANATIAKGYNAEELQYDASLNCWKIHKGLDLVASVGDDVLAVYDGKVTNITSNYLDGTTIEITHENGLVSLYRGLSSETSVKVGDSVTQNQSIGKVGSNAESETGTHVHFELIKDGENVDPLSYIQINGKD